MATTPTQDATFVAALNAWLSAGPGGSSTQQDNTFYTAAKLWLSQGSSSPPIQPPTPRPVVAPASFTVSSGYGLDALIGTLSSDISCTGLVISGDPNNYFAAYASNMHLRTSATVTVPPGTYAIQVAGRNANGIGPAAQVSLTMQAAVSPPPPPPPPPPSSGVWPDASNTGVPAGTVLTPSPGLTITTAGAVISGLDINDTVEVAANNVTLKNCKIHGVGYYQVHIAVGVTGTVVENCTIDAGGAPGGINQLALCAIGDEGSNSKFLNNNLSNFEHGISLINSGGNGDLIQGNYLHDFNAPASLQPHYDGIEINGPESNVSIIGNTIINRQDNSCVMIDNYFGSISNVKVDGNLLCGGTYVIFVDGHFNSNPVTNVSITNNHYGNSQYGFIAADSTNPTMTGNINDGEQIALMLKQ